MAKCESYEEFVEKFKPKKTTYDCYTPEGIYDVVRDYVIEKYDLQGCPVIRPFWPGGDYEKFDYPENCVVIDNPPFSILARILDFYAEKKIEFFLFAPQLTVMSSAGPRCNIVITGNQIVYENKAVVATSFATNLGEFKIDVDSELYRRIQDVVEAENQKMKRLKYSYPTEVLTTTTIQKLAGRGIDLRIKEKDCFFTRALDAQRKQKKSLYGAGFLLSKKAAAEKKTAEKKAAEKDKMIEWELSDREREIIEKLGA